MPTLPQSRGLSARLDTLNAAIERAESALSQNSLSVSAEVLLDPGMPEIGVLGYGKVGGRWRFFVKEPKGKQVLLVNAQQQFRLLAAYRLEALMEELIGTTDSRIQEVEGAIKKFETFAEEISATKTDK